MLVSEIIQRVQGLYSKGTPSDDVRFPSRHIYNKILTNRSKLISRQAKKRQKISQWNYQTLPCVELIKANPSECPCLPPVGCEIYRTKFQLPDPVTDLNQHLFQSVTTTEGSVVFSEITWLEKKYKSDNKYTASKPDFYIRNKYLYVTQKKGASIIAVTALFEDPWKAHKFPSYCDECSDCNCGSPLDMEFPIDNDLIDDLVNMTYAELVVPFAQAVEDTRNDSMGTQIEWKRNLTQRPDRRIRNEEN